MSVAITATGQSYARSALTPNANNWTICGWFQRTGTGATFKTLFWIDDGGSGYEAIWFTDTHDMIMQSSSGSGASTMVSGTVANTWYFVAMRSDASGVNHHVGSYRLQGATSLTNFLNEAPTMPASSNLIVGNDPSDEVMVGLMARVRVWEAYLPDADLMAESRSLRAVRRQNLTLESPFASPSSPADITDLSAYHRNWFKRGVIGVGIEPPLVGIRKGVPRRYVFSMPSTLAVPALMNSYRQRRAG